ncbi:MAG: pilus assembly protein [Alphaproteobacteria bacterium]|nr:pilus assembly protein [Alphaproteobacteria bacterium]
MAAIEFALTLPVWIALLIGTLDGAYMMLLSQRVDRITYSVTDLVTQLEVPSLTDLHTIMLAAGELMNPFPFGANGVVIVTSLTKPAGLPVKIDWQQIDGGSLARGSKIGTPGFPPSMPNGLTLNDKENVIITEVYYAFKPLFINAGILSAHDMYSVAVYKPRLSTLSTPPT